MNKNQRNIFIVGDIGSDYANWMEGNRVRLLEDADLVLFTGGEDVDPSYYNEKKHPTTYSNISRDIYEAKIFERAREMGKKMIGICRGAQFLCVMSGGKLVQHQQNPAYLHPIRTFDNNTLVVTSTHHQAQYPWGLPEDKFKLLGWSVGISAFHEDGNQKELDVQKEVEAAFYPESQALCIQGHPEAMHNRSEAEFQKSIKWHRDMLNLLMEGKL
jgi:putative glutamine amidotransferase